MDVVEFAHQIIELEESRDFWRREAEHYKHLYNVWFDSAQQSADSTMQLLGDVLVQAIDPNSGLNKMHRALERDPLKGEISPV